MRGPARGRARGRRRAPQGAAARTRVHARARVCVRGTCGHTWTYVDLCGHGHIHICPHVNAWTRVDRSTCGHVDTRTCGQEYTWTCVRGDTWARGHVDTRTCGQVTSSRGVLFWPVHVVYQPTLARAALNEKMELISPDDSQSVSSI